METQKQCKVCKQVKDFNEFKKNARSKDGHAYTCKACIPVSVKSDYSGPFGHVELHYKKGIEYTLTGEINGNRIITKTFGYANNGAYFAYEEFFQLEADAKFGVGNWRKCIRCHAYKPITSFKGDGRFDYYNDEYYEYNDNLCNECVEEEKDGNQKYREKIKREGVYYTFWRDADSKWWDNVHVKEDCTILKNGSIVKKGKSYLKDRENLKSSGCLVFLSLGILGIISIINTF
jgi:hypothetical protein